MRFLITAALAIGLIGTVSAPTAVDAQSVSRTTTVRERNDGTVVRRTVVRRDVVRRQEVRRGYRARNRRTVCTVRYRNGARIRTCRTAPRYR